ncbi:unnamed protein product [Polarella glacialis]|uniref:NAD(+)--protein-arginine ADP-ribosyltransferase n=1 Tax=Polarella glacialis TaxID=89957 RepID=A0A813J3U3_POLGL|nr:unnamed protein product [Polarella glacialis]CAE8663070.1 unnamed protein product [Polarella glacialis]
MQQTMVPVGEATAQPHLADEDLQVLVASAYQSADRLAPPQACVDGEGEPDIEVFERLDKWKRCDREVGEFLVCQQNTSRAKYNGFPSTLEVGIAQGLTSHEVAALFGWTTGDFRFINPIARGLQEVTFEDYPNAATKVLCSLTRHEVLPYVQLISSALRKLPACPGQRLWRGHRRAVPSELGTVLVLRGFTSASYDRDESIRFAAQVNAGKSVKRTLIAFEEHFSGRSIAKLSARRREAEVLFPLDTRFQVVAGPVASEADSDELSAVQSAVEEMRATLPEADIRIVYLREVSADAVASSECAAL